MQKTLLISVALSTLLLHATENNNLEKRIKVLEKALNKQKQEKLKKALKSGNSFNQKGFIPDISLILNGSAVARNIDNDAYEGYAIQGFVEETEEIPFNKNRGFNLNYAEFGMHSEVGPYFDADTIFHLSPNEFEIEEAYITTKKLPANIKLKAGSFKSGFGRINAIHKHAQHFSEQPLVYEAMLGVEGIKDAGLSLNWVAPTDTYMMVGAEALQGTNELSFGKSSGNNLYIGYLKTGFDVGENTSILTGASIAFGKTQNSKNSRLYGGEFTLKHTLDSYSSVAWQSEYLYRNRENIKQSGYYTQLIYNKDSNWEFGVRYDALNQNRVHQPDDLKKYSALVQYKPFEFTKLRLQLNHDKSKSFGGVRRDEKQVMLEFLVETGSHGSHSF